MYDLLADNPGNSDSLAVLEDAHGGTYVSGDRRERGIVSAGV